MLEALLKGLGFCEVIVYAHLMGLLWCFFHWTISLGEKLVRAMRWGKSAVCAVVVVGKSMQITKVQKGCDSFTGCDSGKSISFQLVVASGEESSAVAAVRGIWHLM